MLQTHFMGLKLFDRWNYVRGETKKSCNHLETLFFFFYYFKCEISCNVTTYLSNKSIWVKKKNYSVAIQIVFIVMGDGYLHLQIKFEKKLTYIIVYNQQKWEKYKNRQVENHFIEKCTFAVWKIIQKELNYIKTATFYFCLIKNKKSWF